MLRRPITEEPMSRLAAWSSRLAWFALVLAALSIIVVRTDFIEIVPGLVAFGTALALAGLAILCSFGAAVVIWRHGHSGIGRAVWGFILSMLLLAYPGYLAAKAYQQPALRDVTTDTANPPRFDALSRLRPRGTSDYPGAQAAALQREAYPDVAPLQVLSNPRQTYDATLAIVNKHKWRVVDARPPTPPARRDGAIEAVARTTIMGFREDVVIRITPIANGAQVDIRSASRFGDRDFGSNASRIVSLLEEIDEAAGTPPEPRAAPQRQQQRQQQQQQQQRQPARR